MYMPDLSPYRYARSESPMLAVGWLADAHTFDRGDVPAHVVERLIDLAFEMPHLMRGCHYCPFCDEESPIRIDVRRHPTPLYLGMSEIHVRSVSGVVYSAPSLVLHYLERHRYRPPEEFVRAVEERDGHERRGADVRSVE